ncbi:hypothetical protein E4T56_gene20481 [Termitomyces sp. T112]|nr:hypothetical protein E4T56_gene20481 [Termitomyces sp. T112]
MYPTKVDAILNWPSPRNVKEVQSFLGFANFYCHFIDNYSGITKPLNQLTWKDTPWDWDSKCQSVFLLLKKAFTSTLVLCHFDPSLLIVLECDASNYTIARILSQSDLGGKDLHPVAFYTRSMIPAELNYDIYNKELLAIVEAFCQWQAYLKGSAATKLNGPKPSQSMILLFITTPGDSAQSPMPSLKDPMYISSHVAHEVAENLRFLHQFLQDKIDTTNQVYSKHANARHKLTPNWPPGTLSMKTESVLRRWEARKPLTKHSLPARGRLVGKPFLPPPSGLPQHWNPAGSPVPLSLLSAASPPPPPPPTPANAPSAPPTPADKTIAPWQSPQ